MPIRLIRCPRCNAHVRDADEACPCCGAAADAPRRGHRAVVAAAVVVGIAAAGCAYGPPSGDFYTQPVDTADTTVDTTELPDGVTGTADASADDSAADQ